MSAEWDLLCRLTAPDGADGVPGPDRTLEPDGSAAVDWDRVRSLAAAHRVESFLAAAARGRDAVPAEQRERAGAATRGETMRGLQLTDGLYDVLGRLDAASIRALPYKGPVLSTVAYDDPGTRQYRDLDVLVAPEQFDRAREALEAAEYRQVERLRGLGEVCLADGDGLRVDLHRAVLPRFFPAKLTFDDLWERRTTVDPGNDGVPALDPADRLVVLAVHGTKHCWYRLAWVRDVATLVADDHADPARLEARARDCHCLRHVLVALWLADRVYGVAPPRRFRERVAEDPAVEKLGRRLLDRVRERDGDATPPTDAEQFRVQWLALSRRRDRLLYATRLATLPSEADVRRVALPPPFRPLYRVVRPARLVSRAGRAGCRRLVAVVS